MRALQQRACMALGAALVLGLPFGCGDDDKSGSSGSIVIGGLFNQSATSGAQTEGARQAARDANESGIFKGEVKLVGLEFNDNSDRQEMAKQLHDDHGAIGMVSEWSSTALNVLNVTNDTTGNYANFVNCSSSSTNTIINDPSTPVEKAPAGMAFASDQNDTLYRGVSNDKKQANLAWALVEDKASVGVFFVGDAYGQTFRDELFARATAADLVFDADFPADNFAVSDVSAEIDEILALNLAGTLKTLVFIGLPSQGGPVMKALTEATKPFAGTIIVADGSIQASFFGPLTGAFTTWLAQPGNKIVGTAPENYAGGQSAAFTARLTDVVPNVDLSDAFIPSAADCTYAFIVAALYAGDEAGLTPAGIKANMGKLKKSYLDTIAAADLVTVTASPEGLAAARDAIAAGKTVKLDGASGMFMFDDHGDRMNQPYKTMEPVAASGGYTWERVSIHDGDTGLCTQYCP